MMRNVYLEGELGAKFGAHFRMDCISAQEILKNISANRDEFKPYLVECAEKNINLDIIFDGEELDEEGCVTPLKDGDVTILVVPSGSKNGIGKLFAAAALFFIAVPMAGAAGLNATMPGMLPGLGQAGGFSMQYAAAMKVGMTTTLGKFATYMAVNMALTGVAEMMAPDPSVDTSQPTNYLFNGEEQHLEKGDPVPLLYGELRVPGRPISMDIMPGVIQKTTSIINADNSMSLVNYKMDHDRED